jgi:hypothetical protein
MSVLDEPEALAMVFAPSLTLPARQRMTLHFLSLNLR